MAKGTKIAPNATATSGTIRPRSRMSRGGSFQNRMQEMGVDGQPVPVVGMGATELMYSDRHAHTIASVESGPKGPKRIGTRRDIPKRTDTNGMSESQVYQFTPAGEDVPQTYWTLRKTGQWIREGDSLRSGTVLRIGDRSEYRDPSF